MLAVYIDFGKCFAQPIALTLALLVGWRARLRSAYPIQDPQPH